MTFVLQRYDLSILTLDFHSLPLGIEVGRELRSGLEACSGNIDFHLQAIGVVAMDMRQCDWLADAIAKRGRGGVTDNLFAVVNRFVPNRDRYFTLDDDRDQRAPGLLSSFRLGPASDIHLLLRYQPIQSLLHR